MTRDHHAEIETFLTIGAGVAPEEETVVSGMLLAADQDQTARRVPHHHLKRGSQPQT